MEFIGVIARIEQSTQWCAGMVAIPKRNGSVRTVQHTGNVASIHMQVMLVSSRRIVLCNALYKTCGTSCG